MDTVQSAGAYVRRVREEHGWSQAELARRADALAKADGYAGTVTQQQVNLFERGETKRMPVWRRYIDQALGLAEPPPVRNEVTAPGLAYAPPPMQGQPRDVPVYGSCLAAPLSLPEVPDGIEQIELGEANVVEYVRRPPTMIGNRQLYALYVQTGSMEPRYRTGALIFVDPRRPAAGGDDVVVQLRDGNGHDGDERVTCAILKRLVRRTPAGLELEQYSPPLTFFVPAANVKAVHRVPEMAELMGF